MKQLLVFLTFAQLLGAQVKANIDHRKRTAIENEYPTSTEEDEVRIQISDLEYVTLINVYCPNEVVEIDNQRNVTMRKNSTKSSLEPSSFIVKTSEYNYAVISVENKCPVNISKSSINIIQISECDCGPIINDINFSVNNCGNLIRNTDYMQSKFNSLRGFKTINSNNSYCPMDKAATKSYRNN